MAGTEGTSCASDTEDDASLAGPVKLLTSPASCGYVQNPISVYYCYSPYQTLEKCIAEVGV